MNKLLFLVAVVAAIAASAFDAHAQVKIGNNPNTIHKGSILELESDTLGVLFPRVDLTDLATWAPLKGTAAEGMTVYNTNTTTGKGFYFWDGTKWVKPSQTASDQEWMLQPADSSIKLVRSGTLFPNKISYQKNGRYFHSEVDSVPRIGQTLSFYPKYGLINELNAFNVTQVRADLIPKAPVADPYLPTVKDYDVMLINEASVSGNRSFSNQENLTYIDQDVNTNFVNVQGMRAVAVKYSPNKINEYYALSGITFHRAGTASIVGGGVFIGAMQSADTISSLIGTRTWAQTNDLNPGDENGYIRDAMGTWTSTRISGSKTIENLEGLRASNILEGDPDGNPKIENMIGLRYQGFLYNAPGFNPEVNKHYGLYIDNVTRANENWAIYTNNGIVYFGDSVGIGEQPDTKLNLSGRTFKLGYAYQQDNTTPSSGYRIIESNGTDLKLAPPLDQKGWVKINDSNTPSFLGFKANGHSIIRSWYENSPTNSLAKIRIQTAGLSIGDTLVGLANERLVVEGNTFVNGISAFPNALGDKISLYGGTNAATNKYGLGVQNSLMQIYTSGSISDIAFGYGRSDAFTENVRFKGNGNVGIGVNPTHKLHVAGDVYATGTVYASNGAAHLPDYVFENYYKGTSSTQPTYQFMPLEKVENYIKTNGHLPGYKSAKEVKEDGKIDITQHTFTNMEKVEELYLHVIEQEKENKQLRKEVEQLKILVKQLITK